MMPIAFACPVVARPPRVAAADWPQWLGPRRDGASPKKGRPLEGAPRRSLWKQPVGEGHSSPVVAGGKVFLHTKVEGQGRRSASPPSTPTTGKPLWHAAYDRGAVQEPLRQRPARHARRRRRQGLHLRRHRHPHLLRRRRRQAALAGRHAQGVQGHQPVLRRLLLAAGRGDHVLVNVGGKGASIVAFDKDNGKVAWKTLDDKASYSSPIVFGQAQAARSCS